MTDIPVDIEVYLRSKGLNVKRASATEVHVPCWYCNEPDDKRGRLYINIDPLQDPPALFFCHLCGEKGALNKIRKHFGDSVVSEQDDRSYIHNDILQEAAAYYHDQLVEHPEALNYLKKKRGLTIETIVKHQLGYADGTLRKALQEKGFLVADMQKTGLVTGMNEDFLKHHITIPYHVSGHVVMIRGRDFDTGAPGKYATPYGARTRLFNTDVLWRDNDMAVVTEGEFDCLVMEQLGYPTVGSPGSNVWQPSWNSYFDSTKRVFVLFDNDPSGLAGAEKVSHQIGPKARIVYLQGDDKTDPSELVVEKGWGAADFDLLFRRSRGGHLLSVDDGFEEWQGYRGVDGLKLGIERIDQVLAPGILPGQVMVVLAKTGTGKSSVISEEIPTPDGIRTVGDLRVGDYVFGRDGAPTKVIGVYDRGVLPTYRVTFSDSVSVTAGADHIWRVRYRYGHHRDWVEKDMTTSEIVAAGLRHNKEYRFTIPMCAPVQYPEQDLPVEPYLLGSLIANGTLGGSTPVLTTPDDAVVERVRVSHEARAIKRPVGACPAYTLPKLGKSIRRLGLNVHSRDKFIPESYLLGSVEQRVALLQGLMDGDGGSRAKSKRRSVHYFTTSHRLADDVVQLVTSLGGTAMQSWTRNNTECAISIMLPSEVPPFSTDRKNLQADMTYQTEPRRAIVSIEREGEDEHRCIAVDAPDSLYLIGRHHIVTHNTLFLLNTFQRMIMANPNVNILFVSLEQTRGEWFERARRIYRFYNLEAKNTDCLEYFRNRLMLVDKNRVTEDELIACLDQYEYEQGKQPDVVAIDYLGYWARAYKGEPYERTGQAIMAIKAIAKDRRIAVITPHQVNRMTLSGEEVGLGAARDSGVVEETADFLLGLWSPDQRKGKTVEERSSTVALKILKSRHGGSATEIHMQFAPLCLAMIPQGDPLVQRAMDDLKFMDARDNFPTALWRHRTGNRDLTTGYRREEEDDE